MTGGLLVGLDIGGTHVRAGAFDFSGALLAADHAPIQAAAGPQAGLARLAAMISGLCQRFPQRPLAGIGIGSTGPVNIHTGVINNPFTLPTWENVSVTSPLSARFGVPVTLENDGNVAALGEYWQGAGRGVHKLYAVTVGTGVGVSFVWDGRVHRGIADEHPEGGHHIVDPCGPLCYCGSHGCWESMCAGPAIARQAQARLASQPDSLILALAHGDLARVDSRHVTQAASQGDPLALEIMERVAGHFSLGLANVIQMFLPEVIVLSGGVMQSLPLFMPAITAMLERIDVMVPARRVRILPAQLGTQAGIYGAAYSVLRRISSPEATQ